MLRTVFGQFGNLPGQLCPAQHRAGHGAAELRVLADSARRAADDPANVRFAQQLAGVMPSASHRALISASSAR